MMILLIDKTIYLNALILALKWGVLMTYTLPFVEVTGFKLKSDTLSTIASGIGHRLQNVQQVQRLRIDDDVDNKLVFRQYKYFYVYFILGSAKSDSNDKNFGNFIVP